MRERRGGERAVSDASGIPDEDSPKPHGVQKQALPSHSLQNPEGFWSSGSANPGVVRLDLAPVFAPRPAKGYRHPA